ncbi:partial Serine 3-dehydrogenase, partial [Gammaproteobacteria bacterium]
MPDKTVLVTGASAGFGAATARQFVSAGWRVIACARRAERLQPLADEFGERVHIAAFDVRDESAMQAALDALPAPFRAIDVLVNNAGLALGTAKAPQCELAQWRQMIDTNVTALATLTHKLLPILIAQRGEVVADVIEHEIDAVAATLVLEAEARTVEPHVDRVGVAEQVVDVAERFLVGADHEDAESIRLARARRVQRQAHVQTIGLDITVDATIRIAGEIGDHAAAIGRLVEPFDRHDRKHLVDRPHIGNRLEH